MKAYGSYLAAMVVGLGVLVSAEALATDAHGVVQVAKGDVQIKSAKDGKITRAKVGAKVFARDTIITGKDARAKIVMVDNNVINVSPDTSLEIKNYEYQPEQGKKDVLLNVIYGKVRSKVEQKYDGKSSNFRVKTPTAVAGVRGTDFMAGYNPTTQVSSIVTFEGSVAFGQLGPGDVMINPVAVTPGQMSEMIGNQPPPAPVPVPPQQLAAMDKETRADGVPQTDNSANDPRSPAGENKEKKRDGDQPRQPDEGKKPEGGKKPDDGKADSAANRPEPDKGRSQGPIGDSRGGDGAKGPVAETPGLMGGRLPVNDTAGGDRGTGQPPLGAMNPPPEGMLPGREPANAMPPMPEGSMLRPEDLAGAPTSVVMPSLMPITPLLPPPLPPPNLTGPICDFCTRVIENGNSVLIIRVNH